MLTPDPLCLLPAAATVTVSPSSRVLEGDSANLTCHLSSDSPAVPNVTWYHNGQWVAEGSATLVLRRVASRDSGLYRCSASAGGSSRSSPDILLDVLCKYSPPGPSAWYRLDVGHLDMA
ncbi:hypothetical protein WISP_00801 [Willisornis vidua]|uniref:Ig-like domain-containing protein n=1 Tax=Willisornis vidua TaxID=1566151 RepID=A0ABQ9E0Y7_9PASS|nr:hypothetical protein WISP_00801 [Willisornis vidua]